MQESKLDKTKRCSKCKSLFPLSGYYKRRASHDGLTAKCKSCIKADIKIRRLKAIQLDREGFLGKKNKRERSRYRESKEARIKTKESVRSRLRKLPAARRAYLLVWKALKKGVLIKPKNCQRCNKEASLDAHHKDYNKPLDVVWLCRECHAAKIEIDISADGTASTDWWTEEAHAILSALGPPAPGYEEVNRNMWCG
jgi:hypothetical protein